VVARSALTVILAGAGAMLLLADCGSFGEADTPPDASAPDGSSAPSLDGSSDGSSVGPSDASNVDGGEGRFCDRADRKAASFCSDFDDDAGTASSFGWESQPVLDGLAFSAPRAAKISLGAGTHSCAYVGLRKRIAKPARGAHVELAVRLGDATGQPPFTANVLQLNFNGVNGADICALFFTASSSGGARVWEQDVVNGMFTGTGSVDVPTFVNRWGRVAIDIALSAALSTTGSTFSVSVDGKPADTVQMRDECRAPAAEVELNVGFRCYDGSTTSPLDVRVDDVLLDVIAN
jgi:hypothetical protein